MNGTKHIIIPIGFNAAQSKEGIMQQMPSSYAYEWMESEVFVRKYLYSAEDGPYETPVEVWLLVWDSPGQMVPFHKGGCSSLYVKCMAVGINLSWCKHHHKGLTVHVIKVLPPTFGQKSPVIEDSWFRRVVNHFHTVDYQEEMAHADPNLAFAAFLRQMNEKIAEMIKMKP